MERKWPKFLKSNPHLAQIHRNCQKVLWVCFVFILILGACYTLWLPGEFRYFDELNYDHLARNLAETGSLSFDGSHLTAWRPPGYPFVLSIFYYLGGGVRVFRFLNFLFLAGSVFFCYRIAKRISPMAAVFTCILATIYPLFYYTAGTLYPQTMGMFFMLLTLDLLLGMRESWVKLFLLALGTAFLMLTVPSFLVLIPLIIGYYIFGRPRRFGSAFLYVAFVCLFLAPWTVRNYILFGQFVFIATNGGVNLSIGNSPEATPFTGVQILERASVIPQDVSNEAQVDTYYRNAAFEYMKQHKWHTAMLYLGKLFHYFHYKNTLATESEGNQGYWILLAITYYPLLLGVFIRFFWFDQPPLSVEEKICLSLYLMSALFAAIFFTRIRFRVPYDALLIIFNGIFLSLFLNVGQKVATKRLERS